MSHGFLERATTPSVRAEQKAMGSEGPWSRATGDVTYDRFTAREEAFIGERDSFYIATVGESGWPYMQHRGGPRGFLTYLDDRTLAFANYRGNRQYISVGNAKANDRACLFLMDYARRARLKIYMRIEVLAPDADPALTERVTLAGYRARLDHVIRLHLEAFNWNCPQHITPRFTEAEFEEQARALLDRLEALESENRILRARLAAPALHP